MSPAGRWGVLAAAGIGSMAVAHIVELLALCQAVLVAASCFVAAISSANAVVGEGLQLCGRCVVDARK